MKLLRKNKSRLPFFAAEMIYKASISVLIFDYYILHVLIIQDLPVESKKKRKKLVKFSRTPRMGALELCSACG